jgi:hypothetical protein
MKVFELYDQFTTAWARIRAYLTSHLIAAGLLWLIGFKPPLPAISMNDLQEWVTNPLSGWFQGVGFLAILTFGVALLVCLYAIALNAIGNLLVGASDMLFPPNLELEDTRRLAPRDALFTIAATLDGGIYQASDLGKRFSALLASYPMKQPEAFQNATVDKSTLKRDATTYFRNALVFLLAWCLIPLLFDGPVAEAVKSVFWRGLFVLLIYVLMARARFLFALRVTIASLYSTVAALVFRDEAYAGHLATARAYPAPYWQLVDAFREQETRRRTPSVRDYVRAVIGLKQEGDEPPAHRESRLDRWYRFGSNEEDNRDYRDRRWPIRYLKWRIAGLVRGLGKAVRFVLTTFGLRAP